jgi:aryl-alcohol dehydrogenase-like predicted oxidoreductase
VEELKQLADAHNASLVAMALQWVVRQPGFAQVVVGARKPEQIRANVEAFQTDLPEDLFLKMTALSDRLQAELPEVTNFWRNDF